MSDVDDRKFMGTPEAAKDGLVEAARVYRSYQGPRMDTAAGHKKHEVLEREAKTRLASAALLWLWHEEHPIHE